MQQWQLTVYIHLFYCIVFIHTVTLHLFPSHAAANFTEPLGFRVTQACDFDIVDVEVVGNVSQAALLHTRKRNGLFMLVFLAVKVGCVLVFLRKLMMPPEPRLQGVCLCTLYYIRIFACTKCRV